MKYHILLLLFPLLLLSCSKDMQDESAPSTKFQSQVSDGIKVSDVSTGTFSSPGPTSGNR
ncbi:hypothetical protein KBD33_04040 [Candidatus Gracilibacteria bacterium]|nr:hypothetical protein [Candidatus Gracilibacteria bacterium]